MKATPVIQTKHGFSVRIRCGRGQNPRFKIHLQDQAAAQRRADQMVELARRLVAAGYANDAPSVLQRVAAGHVDEAMEFVARLCATPPPGASELLTRVTFQDPGERWTTGELAREFPDHVKVKATSKGDHQRLSRLYPSIGAVPLCEFSLADAKRAMATIPSERRPATRRHYAQVISRILGLAVWPCELISSHPLPKRFIPRTGKRPEITPLWWTPRKGLFSSEIRQCRRENHTLSHSRRTPSAD